MSQELISIFNLDKHIQDLYFNELKSFAYKTSFAEAEDGEKFFDESYYAITVSSALDLFMQLHGTQTDPFWDNPSLNVLYKQPFDTSDKIFEQFFADENLTSIFYYSLLNEFIKVNILVESYDANITQANKEYKTCEKSGVDYEQYSDRVNYYGTFKFIKENFCGNDLPDVEFLAEINYHDNETIMSFIQEHGLSEQVADVLFNFAVFEFKYFYDNDVTDDDYSARIEQFINELLELGVNPSVVSFQDRFISVKFKDVINNLSQKFLKANKKYSNAKLLASILEVDKAASNMFALSIMALDKLNDMSKNKELTKLKSKHHQLDLKILSCVDLEFLVSCLQSSIASHFFESFEDTKEALKKREIFAVFFCFQSFIVARKANYELLKASCATPYRLSLVKLKSVLKDSIKLDFVLSCYELSSSDPDVLLLKSDLNSAQLRTCNLFIDNAGYFTPTGLVKGFLGKL